MSKDRSGPAFPTDDYYDEKLVGQHRGMTLRDYFAGQALAGMLACPDTIGSNAVLAAQAYAVADAMVERRAVQT